ncbi:hypothetical protein [Bacillus smithii]|uniref:Uncharacterized protein n=1 Tax=Bacillus smithii 7_3_47FAA TaxID=665952 RepID=G9QJ25_9BACI|nr:hypothetical protein [Bacillus smithii]EHL78847.1 hypothetical protein HMPREF1015_02186 [Bacillus smithii 7_3_47FAA]
MEIEPESLNRKAKKCYKWLKNKRPISVSRIGKNNGTEYETAKIIYQQIEAFV